MFRNADPSRRTPVWLQAYTKENFIWQLKMLALLIVGSAVKDWYDNRQYRKNRRSTKK